jgi:hypothetical protein
VTAACSDGSYLTAWFRKRRGGKRPPRPTWRRAPVRTTSSKWSTRSALWSERNARVSFTRRPRRRSPTKSPHGARAALASAPRCVPSLCCHPSPHCRSQVTPLGDSLLQVWAMVVESTRRNRRPSLSQEELNSVLQDRCECPEFVPNPFRPRLCKDCRRLAPDGADTSSASGP